MQEKEDQTVIKYFGSLLQRTLMVTMLVFSHADYKYYDYVINFGIWGKFLSV